MAAVFPFLSDESIGSIVDAMNGKGFGVAMNCVEPEVLASLRETIAKSVDEAGGNYVGFVGGDNIHDAYLTSLAVSPEFIRACRGIYAAGTNRKPPAVPFYQVLRCLSGQSGAKHSYIFHYDSYVLTALVPIVIPTEGMPGDLIMLPNSRKFRKTYMGNLIDKVLLDNPLTQAVLRKLILSGWMKSEKVRMTPGNIYFFWGCRTIHANEPCDTDKVRATALYHYVDPHAESWLRRVMRQKTLGPVAEVAHNI